MTSVARRTCVRGLALVLLCGWHSSLAAHSEHSPDEIAVRTAGMISQDGFIAVHYDEATGRLFLELSRLGEELIYANGLAQGVGGLRPRLDRGMLEYTGRQALVRFERHGPNILLVAENTNFRAQGGDEWQARAVAESFPSAVYAAFPIDTEDAGRYLVDATAFFLSDVFDVRGRLRDAGQGDLRLDPGRSYISTEYTRAFPENAEIRAVLTYVTDAPGPELIQHAPDAPLGGRVITLQQHHSFVALPTPGFRPRRFDPRVGLLHTTFWDFSQSFDGDYRDRHIWRWRLEKRDPAAVLSEPVRPIVFHIDPSIPEPYRTAYIDGTLWWNRHFEAAGFRNAIEVRDLPDGADPMDVRYSTILLVHRTVAGSSTAPHIQDPRTGEILHAIVRMDSHRSLTDYNLYMGLVPALGATGSDITMSAEEMIVLRRKQHVAHEVGHALGFGHNYIAASLGRESVMDYPPPFVKLNGRGGLDISELYRDGGGAHDTFLAQYAYTQFDSPGAEAEGLSAIVREALAAGQLSLAGRDANRQAAYPEVHQWVEGATMIEALERTLAVRAILMEHFSDEAIRPGEPMAVLADRLAHVYLHHRYSLEGAIKYVGGMSYTYALRGDGQTVAQILPAARQRRALELVLSALRPESLAVPERVSRLIPPSPHGYAHSERWVRSPTGLVFDPLALARVLAADIVDGLLHPERAARLVSFAARDPSNLSLDAVLAALVDVTWNAPTPEGAMETALIHITQRAVLDGMFGLVADARAPAEVRAIVHRNLVSLAHRLEPASAGVDPEAAHRLLALDEIARFVETGQTPALRTGISAIELPWP